MASTPASTPHTDAPHNMRQLSNKRRPIAGFGDTRTGFWIGVSLAIHVVFLLATSVGFLRDTFIDPAGAAARKEAAATAQAAPAETPAAPSTPANTPTPSGSNAAPNTPPASALTNANAIPPAALKPAATPAAGGDEKSMMEERKNSAVVKRVTETSKPSEIPTKPDDMLLFEDPKPKR